MGDTMNRREKLICLSHELEGDWLGMYEILKNDWRLDFWQPKMSIMPVQAITIYDEDYPAALLSLRMPPFVLYYEGDLKLLEEPVTAVMGSFAPTAYALNFAKKIKAASTIAAICDHGVSATVLKRGRSIGMMASGLQRSFKEEEKMRRQEVAANGLVISEYPAALPFSWRRYARVCRLLLEMAESLLIFEIGKEDRRLSLISSFLKEGLPTFVLPDRLEASKSAGGLDLLGEGATAMTPEFFEIGIDKQ